MLLHRMIPCLLLKGQGFVKTTNFKNPRYLGDPINIVKIFNDKMVDELVVLDITASLEGRGPSMNLLANIASQCFMPLAYGGGITTLDEMSRLFSMGIEKVVLNSAGLTNMGLIQEASRIFGAQAVVASIDVKKNFLGKYEIFTHSGTKKIKGDVVELVRQLEAAGAGEILINSIDRDGTRSGYDLSLIRSVSDTAQIPVIACGGVGQLSHLAEGIKMGGASAVAAGSFFVFQGKHQAVLINVPSPLEFSQAIQ